VLPLFFLVIMAVLEFGRAFTLMQLVVESARNGARTAAMGGSTNASVGSQIESSLQTSAGVSPSSVAVDISIQPYSGNPAAGDVGSTHSRDLITVKVTVPYAEASFVPPMFLQTTQLTSQCTVRAE
jgi:hypothetical protein